MAEKTIDLGPALIFWMGLHTMEFHKPENPAASLFSAISAVGTMMASPGLPDLLHQTQTGIMPEFSLVFHLSPLYSEDTEIGDAFFPYLDYCYKRTWNLFVAIELISWKLFYLSKTLESKTSCRSRWSQGSAE
jgi:hypothetical protein